MKGSATKRVIYSFKTLTVYRFIDCLVRIWFGQLVEFKSILHIEWKILNEEEVCNLEVSVLKSIYAHIFSLHELLY